MPQIHGNGEAFLGSKYRCWQHVQKILTATSSAWMTVVSHSSPTDTPYPDWLPTSLFLFYIINGPNSQVNLLHLPLMNGAIHSQLFCVFDISSFPVTGIKSIPKPYRLWQFGGFYFSRFQRSIVHFPLTENTGSFSPLFCKYNTLEHLYSNKKKRKRKRNSFRFKKIASM